MPTQTYRTIIDVLQGHALDRPESTALRFVKDGTIVEAELNYASLWDRASSIAGLLTEERLRGERVILIYPAGLHFVTAFLGCLYAGVIAVPVYPPRPNRPMDRLYRIAADCSAAAILTTSQYARLLKSSDEFNDLRLIITDVENEAGPGVGELKPPRAENIAMLQYTSGSTGMPKGVRVTHGNLIANQVAIQKAFRHDSNSEVASWLPLYHDMGLIGTLLQPLYLGSCGNLMSPLDFLQKPFRWLQMITRFKANTSGGPNFSYDLCVSRVSEEQKASLDLRSWRVAFNGAERVRPETLRRFAEAFAPCGFKAEAFLPCYGMAESTLLAAGAGKDRPPSYRTLHAAAREGGLANDAQRENPASNYVELASCGPPAEGFTLEIVEPETGVRCGPGEVGEIWLAGSSVADGYWNPPAPEEDPFRAYILNGTGEISPDPFLRTGDLGVLLDGELYVAGRLKELIIIEGRNHYPQDIEITVESCHVDIEPGRAAAMAIDVDGNEGLALVIEVDPRVIARNPAVAEGIFKAATRALSETHDLRASIIVLIKRGGLPRTTSGKIQRIACAGAVAAGDLDYLASSRPLAAAAPVAS
jgi:acyl-CoA synthetase (AMP-forming)/AMP-acid ligase II